MGKGILWRHERGANEDPDGDGTPNLREFELGTNPSVTDAKLLVVDMQCGARVCIRVLTASKWVYTFQYCDDLSRGTWRDIVGQQRIIGVDGELDVTDNVPTGHGYYRVVAEIKKQR